ncbi:MAG: hypothetical protein OXG64_07240 [Chloroflexi bacterium]|nr:hypothetical protein [Chloroflexota bacterium]
MLIPNTPLPTYHAISPDGGPPADGVYHLRWDCRNLTRITRRQPERLRQGTGGLELCFNCDERRDRERAA